MGKNTSGDTKTGQATGLLLSNWVRCIGGRYIKNEACEGLKKSVRKLMDSNPGILRTVINIGPALKEFPAICTNYSGETVKTAYLTKWAAFDFLMVKDDAPVTLTIVQAVSDEGKAAQKAFLNRVCVREGNPLDPKDQFWNEMRHAASRMGFEELWGSLTGATLPYRGFLQERIRGILYTSEENLHVCILSEDMSLMPDVQDQLDIERLENMLEYCGIEVSDYIKEGMSEQVVAQTLRQIAGVSRPEGRESYEQREGLFAIEGVKRYRPA